MKIITSFTVCNLYFYNDGIDQDCENGDPTGVFAIGDTGPAGGVVFRIPDVGVHGLEVRMTVQAQSGDVEG